jgi:hypothetical protein
MDKTSNAYKKAKREADVKYEKHSAYKSMYISKLYKEYGGKYKDSSKKDKTKSTSRWLREKWVVVSSYLKDGKKVACGSENAPNIHACRPSVRVNKQTPLTIEELIQLHGKKKLLELVALKKKGKRINWEKGKPY